MRWILRIRQYQRIDLEFTWSVCIIIILYIIKWNCFLAVFVDIYTLWLLWLQLRVPFSECCIDNLKHCINARISTLFNFSFKSNVGRSVFRVNKNQREKVSGFYMMENWNSSTYSPNGDHKQPQNSSEINAQLHGNHFKWDSTQPHAMNGAVNLLCMKLNLSHAIQLMEKKIPDSVVFVQTIRLFQWHVLRVWFWSRKMI